MNVRLLSILLLVFFATPLPSFAASAATTSNAPAEEGRESPDEPPEPTTPDPVGYASGNVYETAVDLRVACPGIDLVLRRSYSSADAFVGDLGYGWTHSYEGRVRALADGRVSVRASGEGGASAACRTFPAIGPGASVTNADGYALSRGADGLYAMTSPGRTRRAFDAAGRLASVTAWDGTRVSVLRDAAGRVERVRHDCGAELVFAYSTNALVRVDSPDPSVWVAFEQGASPTFRVLGRVVRHDGDRASTNAYSYADRPRPKILPGVTKGIFPSRHILAFECPKPKSRPAEHVLLVGKTDANGLAATYEYERVSDSPAVRCLRMEMTDGLLAADLSYGFPASGGKTTTERRPTAAGEAVTEFRFDEKDREIRRTTGDESALTTYGANGDAVRVTTSNGVHRLVTSRACDASHRVVSEATGFDAEPADATRLAWDDARGVPNRVVTPEGRVREWTTDGADVVVFGAGRGDPRLVTRLVGGAGGRPTEILSPDGGRAAVSYADDGRVASVAADGLPRTDFACDALGFVASETTDGPGGVPRVTRFENNWRGRPTRVERPDGTSETFAYDGNGTKVVRRTDALGREDVYEWALGLPVRAARVAGGATNALFSVSHDPQLNVVAIADPLGRRAESYVLDANERIVAATNLEGQVMARRYALGRLVASETRFDGTEVAYGYDSAARLAEVAYPGETLRFGYDDDGLLATAANAEGVVSNEYDAATGWLDASVGADGSEVRYLRSDGGAATSVVSVAGTTAHVLDAAGRRVRTDSPAGRIAYGYCPWDGRLSAVTNANGVVAEFSYDVMDRVTNIAWTAAGGRRLGGFAYRHDAAGRVVSRRHALGTNVFDRVYGYDGLDRLVADGDVSYEYDAAGNRLAKRGGAEGDVEYQLGVGDRLASWTGGSCEHDAAGCATRIVRGGTALDLEWNGQCQLVSVATNGVFAESYAYDALGRRVRTTNLEGATRHVYDDGWQVIADVAEDGSVLRSYVWGDGVDRLLAVRVGSRAFAALTDVQGTVWGYADERGEVVARWTYDAWGNVLDEEVAASAAELRAIRYRFQGREFSAATGLTNFRMRWYDSVTGRWLSKDPIGLGGGLNLYAFCACSPLSRMDASGCWAVAIGGNGSAGAGAAASGGSGVVFGYSSKNGFQIGSYQTGSVGFHVGADASFGTSITIAPFAEDICDLSGTAQAMGGSLGLGLGLSVEGVVPINGVLGGVAVSLTGGASVGIEKHSETTQTWVQKW